MIKADTRHHLTTSGRLHLVLRLVAVTGLLAGTAAALYLQVNAKAPPLDAFQNALNGQHGGGARTAAIVLAVSAVVVALGVFVEAGRMFASSGGKGAAGANSTFQVLLAIAIVVALNVYAFRHEADFDLTRGRQFTFPQNVVSELGKLKSETTIVVLQQHKTFGRLSEKPDRYDYAAERKVVEKVQDTVDRFRKLGPQFRVVVLDVEEEGYDRKLADLTKDDPKLREAIQGAPENSIFFASEGRVQRMSFNEFYQLDKQASKSAAAGRGNLVLQPQGLEALVTRITAIEEKRPKVAVVVVHEALSTQASEGNEEIALGGLRRTLTDRGFDVIDVVARKNLRRSQAGTIEGEPASMTAQESKLTRLEAQEEARARRVNAVKRSLDAVNKVTAAEYRGLKTPQKIDRLNLVYEIISGEPENFTEDQKNNGEILARFEKFILDRVPRVREELEKLNAEAEAELKQVTDELQKTRADEQAIEDIYLADVKAKFTRLLADCDMLFIPRLTILSATTQGSMLPRGLHRLDKEQVDLIRDFMRAGKPVFVCVGPTNYPSVGVPDSDELEALLAERGVELGKQTILYDVESEAFRDRSGGPLGASQVQVPPLSLTPPEGFNPAGLAPNPIAQALQVLRNRVDESLDIRVRAPRPVMATKAQQQAQGFAADFLWTSRESWAERYPFNYRLQSMPQFGEIPVPVQPPQFDRDGGRGLGGEGERPGPLSIAVAVEGKLPAATDEPTRMKGEPQSSRLVVIGHGGIFTKPQLNPATEQLLLVTCNWLLGRGDRLPHNAAPDAAFAADRPWEYPRVAMSDDDKALWHWGAFLGLPAVFVYAGLIVLIIRRLR